MIDGVAFQTRARTVDHLGREQIADCPTAVSELWKNAFDAYARNVALDIFDGDVPVAVVSDDGHGMTMREFVDRWLVVGTESKAAVDRTPPADRNGLRPRPRQGQKGIGRLSCANLGPILLLLSKRVEQPFVAALVDWRLFENPFSNLSDVRLPVVEGATLQSVLNRLHEMVETLADNVRGNSDDARAERIRTAWSDYDRTAQEHVDATSSNAVKPPSREILDDVANICFEERHLVGWPLTDGSSDRGTALLISGINFDLRTELSTDVSDSAARATKDKFFETLTSFVDPFVSPVAGGHAAALDFEYVVRAWSGPVPRFVVGGERQFDRTTLDEMEHRLEGIIDANGRFEGRVKAFGKYLEEPCVIEPPKDLVLPRRSDSQVGLFEIYLASMEFTPQNTTHSKLEFQRYSELAQKYSGFMMFRDKLRVLPYGRTDNDFFEIEMRRSKSAGREFWNHRQMFGRIAIERDRNPNLKDKAGREGLLDNRAAKTLKELVSNLLKVSARRYFGSASGLRDENLKVVRADNRAQRAVEERNKLRQRQRREFRGKLKTASKAVPELVRDMVAYSKTMSIDDERGISVAQQSLEEFREAAAELRLPGVPKTLGTLEEPYTEYRSGMKRVATLMADIEGRIDTRVQEINPAKPRELLDKQVARNAASLHRRIGAWRTAIRALQVDEAARIKAAVEEANKAFHAEAAPMLTSFDRDELTYSDCAKMLDALRERLDDENERVFVPYLGALQSLKETIDLDHLANFGMEELGDLRAELERLNGLAQLGIAVEIVGHDLQDYDDIIGAGLRALPDDIRESKAAHDIRLGYEGLTEQLRFLSPLRLAGQKVQRWVDGHEIAAYVEEFFRPALAKAKVQLSASGAFARMRVFDQPSRLLPVFINLVNNAIYWTSLAERDEKLIVLDVLNDEVVVSDNGPGVDPDDLSSLFGLFFTRKARGGRGVGLYLARANLVAGGHRIRYESASDGLPLSGANFILSLRGAEFRAE